MPPLNFLQHYVSRTRVFFFEIIYKLNFVHGCYSTKVLCLIQWIKKIKYTVIKFIHCFNSNFLGMFWEFFFQGWLLIMWEWKFKRPFRCLHVPPIYYKLPSDCIKSGCRIPPWDKRFHCKCAQILWCCRCPSGSGTAPLCMWSELTLHPTPSKWIRPQRPPELLMKIHARMNTLYQIAYFETKYIAC